MLNIYIPEFLDPPSSLELIIDVEEAFTRITEGITNTETSRRLISIIDQGSYFDSQNFLDRFGNKQPFSYISTGCKAALCVSALPSCVISTIECGFNAIDAILQYCTVGNIILPFDYSHICTLDTTKKDICVGHYHFTSLQRLHEYMNNEFPDAPDLSLEGITCLR